MELLWVLAADAPACVPEANFWTAHERQNTVLRELSRGGVLSVDPRCQARPVHRLERARRDPDLRRPGVPDPALHRQANAGGLPGAERGHRAISVG
jgi:hypothetical protein